MKPLRLAFYADDFTGATDAMEALTVAGVETVLFTSPPTSDELESQFSHLEAIGVASMARSLGVDEMDGEVRQAFELLHKLDPSVVHYKVCSTFDSSPEIGSIGRAADIGLEVLGSQFALVAVGAPALGRYVVFGNLFASDGSAIARLDRHATMRDHPVTPMTESDLRRHLGSQTNRSIGLIDITALSAGSTTVSSHLDDLLHRGTELVVLDTLTEEDLGTIGRLVWESTSDRGPLFVIGSSGVEHALTDHWRTMGELPPERKSSPPVQPVDQIIVLSASAALNTAEQIYWAQEQGWITIAIDCGNLLDDVSVEAETQEMIEQTRDAYLSGENVVLFTALGPKDPSLGASRARGMGLGYKHTELGNELGRRLGELVMGFVREIHPQRVCLAGGDTSGHVVTQLGITALEMIAPTVPGAPLCRAHASEPAVDGLELVLKGGQTGPADFFQIVRTGTP